MPLIGLLVKACFGWVSHISADLCSSSRGTASPAWQASNETALSLLMKPGPARVSPDAIALQAVRAMRFEEGANRRKGESEEDRAKRMKDEAELAAALAEDRDDPDDLLGDF